MKNPCDDEPIHIPGAIQPFGALIAVTPKNLQIAYVSANTEEIFGIAPKELLNQEFGTVFGDSIALKIVQGNDRIVTDRWMATVFQHNGYILIEAESVKLSLAGREERQALDRIQASQSLQELLEIAAQEVVKLADVDRAMIYRFHEDLHGEVVAECVKPGVDSFLGLHYPASDIPLPARAVFLKNWVRMIPEVRYTPVALMTNEHLPLDLGKSLLRAVSPIHIEYLNNMGIGASLTISIVSGGKLWGLIACHNFKANYVIPPLRDACESIGRMVSALITSKIESENSRERENYRKVHKALVDRLPVGNDMAVELVGQTPNLLDLIKATGTSTALYLEGYWVNVGNTPTELQLESLVDWMITHHPGQSVYTTVSLPSEYPEAKNFQSEPCGMLALAVPKTKRNYIFWFRPEIISTVNWAGKPEKLVKENGSLHPRSSFSEWQETVAGQSEKWTELEKEAALELRNAIMAIELRRQYEKEKEARQDAERATQSREELMAVLSHDLKNPLSSIQLSAVLAEKFLGADKNPRMVEFLRKISRATSNMNHLIDDILAVTKLESGFMDLELGSEEICDVIREAVDLLEPIAHEKKINLSTEALLDLCHVHCDRGRVIQVLSNIIGNALKFTPEGGQIKVGLESCGPEFVKVWVKDSGPGINVDHLDYVFDRFWQANQTRRLGTGLGLAIAKGIVTTHGGEIWAESDGKSWTTFIFTLPIKKIRVETL